MTNVSLSAPIRPPQPADSPAHPPVARPSPDNQAKPVSSLYFSPIVRIDPKTEAVVWEFRNPETGEIVRQYPKDQSIQAYQSHAPAEPHQADAAGETSQTA